MFGIDIVIIKILLIILYIALISVVCIFVQMRIKSLNESHKQKVGPMAAGGIIIVNNRLKHILRLVFIIYLGVGILLIVTFF